MVELLILMAVSVGSLLFIAFNWKALTRSRVLRLDSYCDKHGGRCEPDHFKKVSH